MTDAGITAILLAGGKGSRMNYRDKAWVYFAGRPLLEHVIDQIKFDVDQILISRNNKTPAYDTLPYLSVYDENPGHHGPLAGIMSCYRIAKYQNALVLPCDVPVLPSDLVTRLRRALEEKDLAVASSSGTIQPLIFMARTARLSSIDEYLSSGLRSARGWLESETFTEINFEGFNFENINEPWQLR